MRMIGWACLLVCAAAWADIPAVTPAVPDAAWTTNWWMGRHEQKLKEAQAGGAPVVFLGDSITHFWETGDKGHDVWQKFFAEGPRRAINLGFSGDRTEHVLWRLDHGELDGFEAKVVVLMIGTNNTGHKPISEEPPADTIIGVRAVLDKIRAKQPTAKIVLCAIFPRGATPRDELRRRNAVVNHEIQRFADGKSIYWCDFSAQFLCADGTLPAEVAPDRLHPAQVGYEIWASAVMPFIDHALGPNRDLPLPSRFAPQVGDDFYRDGPVPAQAISLIGRREHWWKNPEMWFTALKAHRAAAVDMKGEVDLVFLGDSITHGWEGNGAKVLAELRQTYRILPLGIGGDRVQHVIWRVRHGELDGYQAKLVMLMIGTNNNYGDRAEDVAAGIKILLGDIRAKQPQAKVLLLPVFPRGQKPTDKMRLNNAKISSLIRPFADGKDVIWLDFTDKYLQPDGTISAELMPDFLHPKEEGYRIWAEAARPYFQSACGK